MDLNPLLKFDRRILAFSDSRKDILVHNAGNVTEPRRLLAQSEFSAQIFIFADAFDRP